MDGWMDGWMNGWMDGWLAGSRLEDIRDLFSCQYSRDHELMSFTF